MYVFDSPERELWSVDLSSDVWTAELADPSPDALVERSSVEFLGTSASVVYHRDTRLARFDLDGRTLSPLTDVTLAAPLACFEDSHALSTALCRGGTQVPEHFALAPNGEALAFQAEDGAIGSRDLHGSAARSPERNERTNARTR